MPYSSLIFKRRVFFMLLTFVVIGSAIFFKFHYAGHDFTAEVKKTPQNALLFVDSATAQQALLTADRQQQLTQNYLQRYFSPWNNNFFTYPASLGGQLTTIQAVRQLEQDDIAEFSRHPGRGTNYLKHSPAWLQAIAANMAMENFPNKKQPAITIATADLRVLPTRDPSFGDYRQAGEGYPFDYLQAALLPANLPVFILQTTRDGAWSLVVSFFDIGWVESKALAMANPAFMQQWQSGSYVTFLQDASVFDAQNQFRFQARIGSLLPLAERITTPQTRYSVWIAVADSNQQAVLKKTWIEAQIAAPWPLPITAQQIAAVINQLLKTNYGWGEYNGYRDCSATQMNLFAVFGVWLPRTSEDQRLVGQFVDLSHLHAYAKQQKILSEGQPFLTLLHLPGHVVLYIGEKNKRAYVFHNFWGAHTENLLGQKGRSIYGHAAITPVDLGKGYMNIPKPLLNSVQSMTILK